MNGQKKSATTLSRRLIFAALLRTASVARFGPSARSTVRHTVGLSAKWLCGFIFTRPPVRTDSGTTASGISSRNLINGQLIQLDAKSWPAYRDGTEDDIKRMWLEQVGSATWMAELLLNMRWSIIASEKPVFITIDNPVVPLHPSLQFRGIKNPETSLMFPLSPTRLLWLDNRHHEPKNQYYPLKNNGGGLNGLLWRHAIENMFVHRDPHLVCAEMLDNAESMGFAC